MLPAAETRYAVCRRMQLTHTVSTLCFDFVHSVAAAGTASAAAPITYASIAGLLPAGQFADENEEVLKSMLPPLVALEYYKGDDLYMCGVLLPLFSPGLLKCTAADCSGQCIGMSPDGYATLMLHRCLSMAIFWR